nr:unnamed protein product [Callosobruchus chinensis]
MSLSDSQSELPFITFPEFELKCLIDTGSTRSFITPTIAERFFRRSIVKDPFKISSAHGTSVEQYSITIPSSNIFNLRDVNLKFHLFKFHQHFDCLLGLDNLKLLNSSIDLHKNLLITPRVHIPLQYHKVNSTKISTNFITISPRSEQVIKIKVKNAIINPNDPDYVKCFHYCKTLLTNDPILIYPDFSQPFNLTTDASNLAIGAVLSQGKIGSDRPIAYASRTLSESEINYSVIEKELLAIVYGVQYFRPYLFGRKFKIITDHKPLQWLFSIKDPHSKLMRWRLKLEQYDYEIVYKKGSLNKNADFLSRIEVNVHDTERQNAPSALLEYMETLIKT